MDVICTYLRWISAINIFPWGCGSEPRKYFWKTAPSSSRTLRQTTYFPPHPSLYSGGTKICETYWFVAVCLFRPPIWAPSHVVVIAARHVPLLPRRTRLSSLRGYSRLGMAIFVPAAMWSTPLCVSAVLWSTLVRRGGYSRAASLSMYVPLNKTNNVLSPDTSMDVTTWASMTCLSPPWFPVQTHPAGSVWRID